MLFEKTNLFDSGVPFSGWCTCPSCKGDSIPHEEYNTRSGPENPKQNS